MSLNWNLSKIKHYEQVGMKSDEWWITNGIIWSMLGIGLSNITEDNYREVFARIALMEKVRGHILCKGRRDYPITIAHVKRRIGLTTNVGDTPLKTWLKTLAEQEYREILRRADQAEAAAVRAEVPK